MSSFKFNQLLFVSIFAFASANITHASDTAARGHVAAANEPDPTRDGWVSHVDGYRLEICYRDGLPAIGETVQILRVSYFTVNKTVVRQQFRPVGEARIIAPSSDRCVIGELMSGAAERTDHARAIAAGASH